MKSRHLLIANFSFCAKKKRESSRSSYNWFFFICLHIYYIYLSMNVRFFCYGSYCCCWYAITLDVTVCVGHKYKQLKIRSTCITRKKIFQFFSFISSPFIFELMSQINIYSRDSRTRSTRIIIIIIIFVGHLRIINARRCVVYHPSHFLK